MAYDSNRLTPIETPPNHIGLNVHPYGYIYAYEHVQIKNPKQPPTEGGYPEHPTPENTDKDIYLASRVIPYMDVPHHKNTYIIPASILSEFLTHQRDWAETFVSITPHTREETLNKLTRFTDGSYSTLKSLANNTEQTSPENVPVTTPTKSP